MKKIVLSITTSFLLMSNILAYASTVESKSTALESKQATTQAPATVEPSRSQTQIEETKEATAQAPAEALKVVFN